jgi:hypothetical protein
MENTNNDILKNLFAASKLEKAPLGFTSKVMQNIKAEAGVKIESENSGFLSPQYWMLIGAAFGLALIVVFSMDLNFFSGFDESINLKSLSVILSTSILKVKSFFMHIQISSMALVIMAGLLSLFVLDRLLKKRFSFHMFSL